MVFGYKKSDKKENQKDDDDLPNQIVAEKLVNEFLTQIRINNDGDTPLVVSKINLLINEIAIDDFDLANAIAESFTNRFRNIDPKYTFQAKRIA